MAAAAVLPMIAYGLISIAKGWYFLPNSILLKGTEPDFGSVRGIISALGYCAYRRLLLNPSVLFLYIAVLAVLVYQFRGGQRIWEKAKIIAIIFLATTPLNMQFAGLDFMGIIGCCRYEAYVVGLGIFGNDIIYIILNNEWTR